MRKKIARRKKERPVPIKNVIGIVVASAVGTVFTVLLTLICSYILMKSEVLSNTVGIYFIACVLCGALLSGFTASKKCTAKGILSGLVTSIPFSLTVIVIMLFFTKGQLAYNTLFLFLGIILFSTLGGIFGANTKRRN
ncbi:MAG: TIGR04086 family membrane protein [Oscillospiraceae bacterium]|nr:TIGR04086 family membrane protein [Oscillospiraceae bacterium]